MSPEWLDHFPVVYDANGNKVEENMSGTIHENVSDFGVTAQMTGQTENSTIVPWHVAALPLSRIGKGRFEPNRSRRPGLHRVAGPSPRSVLFTYVGMADSPNQAKDVDDFVSVRALSFNKVQPDSKHRRNTNKIKAPEPPFSGDFSKGRKSGSGPGGRRFKSSLPDQFFQARKLHFWFSVYSDGVEIVDDACFADFPEDFC
jgi:hypothetical protein